MKDKRRVRSGNGGEERTRTLIVVSWGKAGEEEKEREEREHGLIK